MHAQFLDQLAFPGDAVLITNQQDAQQKLGVNRRPTGFAGAILQSFVHKAKADVLIDEPQQMVLRNLIFQPEVVEQRFGTGVLSHRDQQASENENPAQHGQLPSNMLLLSLGLQITVTFSTPTGDDANCCPMAL
jgi:hypothetical protein